MKNQLTSAYFFLSASIVLSAAAQLMLKAAMKIGSEGIGYFSLFSSSDALLWLLLGLSCYGLSMISWLVLLAKWPLSLAYPMLSLSYVLVYLGAASWPLLHEELTPSRSIGLAIVVLGVVLVNKKPAA